jgi:hypothetical protein
MTPGYYPGYPGDSWTEGNASEWYSSQNYAPSNDLTMSNETNASYVKVGSKSIGIHPNAVAIPPQGAGTIPAKPVFTYIRFPYFRWRSGGWLLNAYNENWTDEQSGEMSALDFWLSIALPAPGAGVAVGVKDGNGSSAVSQTFNYPTANNAGGYCEYVISFGPSSNYTIDNYGIGFNGVPIDWTRIVELRIWLMNLPPVMSIPIAWLDGFSIVKRLVAHAQDTSTGLVKTDDLDDTSITDYINASAAAQGELQNVNQPQIYWNIENVGRADIQAGQTFQYGSNLYLLMRELKTTFNKTEGWKMTGMGYEPT